MDWEYLDISALMAARDAQHEATTSGNAGSYAGPIGGMLRRQVPFMTPCSGDEECTIHHASWDELYGK